MPTPFEFFGLPASFDLDLQDLQKRYLQASAACHPDRFTDPLDQADAAEKSALLNHAYQTLRDPEARANALLQILGGPAKEDDKSLPPDLLMEMMELREEMETAQTRGDAEGLKQFHARALAERETRLQGIAGLFRDLITLPPADRPTAGKRIRLELNALRYFQRMIEQSQA